LSSHVYKGVERAGASPTSQEDAIRNAIARASETLEHLRWFEVTQCRGHIEDGAVAHWQVTLKLGFTLED
jgi:flavin-binding protein dodecin